MTATSNHPGGARSRNSDRWDVSGRIYERDGRKFTSVTTIINDGIPKPALIGWAAKMTAEFAIAHPDATIEEMKAARFASSDEASARGTALHKWVEQWALAEGHVKAPTDEVLCKMSAQWLVLADKHNVVPEASEFTVYNEALGYAGTADMVATVDGIPSLVDVKTGKDVYHDAALQLCALAHGEYIGIHNGPTFPMPTFDRCLVAHVRPTFARFYPVNVDEWAWRTFRAARAISQWMQGPSKGAILPAIEKETV